MKAILGKKVGMSRIFDKDGQAISATIIEAGPCYISQIKNKEKDGYNSLQIGFDRTKKNNKPEAGHLKKAGSGNNNLKYLKELRVDKLDDFKEGQEIRVDVFAKGDKVKITAKSKGKGFAGVVKRHHFAGSPKTHGHKHDLRKPGSIGSGYPEHVIKGLRMAGRMGNDQVTLNSEVVDLNKDKNLIILKGGIPGAKNSLVFIRL
jgi:large subunit ribosomal protein L3